jgi:hypothetical protein
MTGRQRVSAERNSGGERLEGRGEGREEERLSVPGLAVHDGEAKGEWREELRGERD